MPGTINSKTLKVQILLFGRLTELLGQQSLHLQDIPDTDALKAQLHNRYSGLQEINYQMAVNQEIIQGNTLLTDGMTVALMPPFSGG